MYTPLTRSKTSKIIEDNIRRSIIGRKLQPGDRLASEKELADSFGVSRQTLREALNALESLGLVELRKGAGGGAFVAEVPFLRPQQSVIDFLHSRDLNHDHIAECRILIEPYAARIAALEMTDDQKDKLVHLQAEAVAGLGVLTRDELRSLEVALHHCIAECVTNPMLRFFSEMLVNLLDEINLKNKTASQDFSQAVIDSHAGLVEAILSGDPDKAEEAMLEDLSLTRGIWEKLYHEQNVDGKKNLADWSVYGDHVVNGDLFTPTSNDDEK